MKWEILLCRLLITTTVLVMEPNGVNKIFVDKNTMETDSIISSKMEVVEIPCCSKKSVPLFIIISIILGIWAFICLMVAVITPGWVRDSFYTTVYGLWYWCAHYDGYCTSYPSFSIPGNVLMLFRCSYQLDTLNAVRGTLIVGIIFNLATVIFMFTLFCYVPKYPLFTARVLNFLAALSTLLAVSIYTYMEGYTGGSLIKAYYHYSYALAWVGFISLTVSEILLIFENYYNNPTNLYKYL